MRIELLGTSFIPQHSDARVLDQLIYKWDHSRQIIGERAGGQVRRHGRRRPAGDRAGDRATRSCFLKKISRSF